MLLTTARDARDRLEETVADRLVEAAHGEDRILARVSELGLTVLTLDDERFPRRLIAVEMPPQLLFVWGDPASMSPGRAVAVVGTRRPSELGRRLAARIAAAVSNAGASVVSGLAVGVDGAAHAACPSDDVEVAEATAAVADAGSAMRKSAPPPGPLSAQIRP